MKFMFPQASAKFRFHNEFVEQKINDSSERTWKENNSCASNIV